MMHAVADGNVGATRWHTKGDAAVTRQHTIGDAAANGKVAANGDSGTNNNQSHFKVPS